MPASTDVAEITRSARVVTSHGGSAVVHLRYDGTLPPTEVLSQLQRAGWRDAIPSPPPAAAVDWSTPDPVAGTRYSLRPFQAVTDAVFTGTREERRAAVDGARDLLRRGGFVEAGDDETGDDQAGASSPAATTGGPDVAPATARDGHLATLEIVADESQASLVRVMVGRVGTVVEERPDARVVEVVFRGNRSETVTAVVRFVAEVPHDHVDALVRELSQRVHELTRH